MDTFDLVKPFVFLPAIRTLLQMLIRFLSRALLLGAALILISPAPARELVNLSTAKEAVVHYIESGCYERDVATVADEVAEWVEQRVSTKSSGEKLALVLDIDETVLSNLIHMRETDFGYLPSMWDAWVAKGTAPAIKPLLTVFKNARRLDVTVVFITGRKETDRPGTEKNLSATGFGDYHVLICKPSPYAGTSEQYKIEARQNLEAEGWTIIANVGDQCSDLKGGSSERVFKLPNPFYRVN